MVRPAYTLPSGVGLADTTCKSNTFNHKSPTFSAPGAQQPRPRPQQRWGLLHWAGQGLPCLPPLRPPFRLHPSLAPGLPALLPEALSNLL